ncbi:MAG TPA: SAM-dependent methyltransferase [Spirochaetota bacterium]|nr:SAM-dependent methyltransferase [Spirochaetota bacterium]HPC39395.1 SAM-dependent methyltransferase [Spirochaetota bacterium]HPL16882.1 SAM-dependent methyltransferase [Spirochaetota bacterium]HQF06732.1 SAM-dependent methyltransferase [Spirochaetota bacterium]HQH95649.1 SAM-dependent methyltransferase [Spirochaetota bacterium]
MSNSYHINDTASYHREGLTTLGWELTVTNALEDASSPCRSILDKKESFGNLLADRLQTLIPPDSIISMLEIGGGYGFLMRDFLRRFRVDRAAMVDLSPVLLNKQRKTLKESAVTFIENDFFSIGADFFRDYDLVLMNEIIGDFPTICDIDPAMLVSDESDIDPVLGRVRDFLISHGLPFPEETFNINTGAIEAVDRLCSAGVKYIYLSEHSCEATVPENMKNRIRIESTQNPERITLMGHCEYTIKFSYLARAAEQRGYRVHRGQYKDFITFPYTDRVNFILTSHSQKDEHEIIRQFIEDLYKYEYLVLIREE